MNQALFSTSIPDGVEDQFVPPTPAFWEGEESRGSSAALAVKTWALDNGGS